MCERVIIINRGRIIADERTEDISRTIESGYMTQLKIVGPQKEVESALSSLSGVQKVVATGERDGDAAVYKLESEPKIDVRKSVFHLCAKNGWPIVGMMPIGTDLESVFIRLVDVSDGVNVKKGTKRAR